MTVGRIGAVRLEMHPAMPVLLAALSYARGAELVGVMLVVLALHEGAHALAAAALGVRIEQIELMPFGGAVRMEGYQALLGWRGAVIAAAGPMANALTVMLCATLTHYGVCSVAELRLLAQCSAALMAINLLPALPMDGGRLVCAALAPFWGDSTSRKALSVLGGGVSVLLIGAGAWDAWRTGQVNATVFLMGSYLLYAAAAEYRVPAYRQMENMVGKRRQLARQGTMGLREVLADADTPVYRLAARLSPREMHRICVVDAQARRLGTLEEEQVVAAMLKNPAQTLREAVQQAGT